MLLVDSPLFGGLSVRYLTFRKRDILASRDGAVPAVARMAISRRAWRMPDTTPSVAGAVFNRIVQILCPSLRDGIAGEAICPLLRACEIASPLHGALLAMVIFAILVGHAPGSYRHAAIPVSVGSLN